MGGASERMHSRIHVMLSQKDFLEKQYIFKTNLMCIIHLKNIVEKEECWESKGKKEVECFSLPILLNKQDERVKCNIF